MPKNAKDSKSASMKVKSAPSKKAKNKSAAGRDAGGATFASRPKLARAESNPSKGSVNLRISAEQKALIDRAAARQGKTRTEFMLDCAREAAENVLLDQRLFLLDEAQHAEFVALLDNPPEPSEALKKLMNKKPVWER